MVYKSTLVILTVLVLIPSGYGFGGYGSMLNNLPIVGSWFGPILEEERSDQVVIPLGKKGQLFDGRVVVGSSKEPYHLIFGTSFSGIWLFSKSSCEKPEMKEKCKNIHVYDDSKIKDVSTKKAFSLNHIVGTISGFITKDSIKIGKKILVDQDIGIVTQWDQSMDVENFDGYFGIQFNQNEKLNIGNPFFNHFYENKVIKEMVYGIYMNLNRGEGQLLLGGTNPKLYENKEFIDIHTIPGGSGWFLEANNIKVGTKEMGTKLKVLIDPSNNNIGGKKDIIDKLNKEIGAEQSKDYAELYLIDCQKELPKLTIDFNGNTFELEGSEYIHKQCFMSVCRCFSYFFVQDLNDFDMILGAPFMQKYYTKFDVTKKAIGFIKANHNRNEWN